MAGQVDNTLAGFTGSSGRPGGEQGLVFPLRSGGQLVVASGAGASGATAYRVAVADPAAVAERLRHRNLPFRTAGDGVTVGAAEAFGVAIQFDTAGTR
ncbi:hypothetical protein D3869_29830 (plasmid) [Azospirillum brasilense]|uniref:Uncharacterized protein n=1 Tax=Azospirillum brasilense TaxID=192 RepID=A0A4D8RJ72_AZOBR|nr:hypothetical protein [Azospirillum brasilense]QCO19449.1 hypothetical protein D3869_29830 [Azospirillum brasilense]